MEQVKSEIYHGVRHNVVKNNCEVGYCLSVNAVLMNHSLRYVCEVRS